ncbi:MAG TPA: hypothetical protein VIJ68_01445 [Candidatus Saccharimonadales bacterium]
MRRRLSLATLLLMLCLFAAPQYALAFDPFGNDCNGDTGSSTVCSTKLQTDPTTHQTVNPLNTTLSEITNIVAFIAGAAAIIIIIVSALRFITSGSDVSTGSRTDTDIEDAKRSIASAIIGLGIIVAARTLLVYVISKI